MILKAAFFGDGFSDGVASSGRGVGGFHHIIHTVSGLINLLSPLLAKGGESDCEQARGDLNGITFDTQGIDVSLARVPRFIRVDLNPGSEEVLGDALGCGGVGDESLGGAAARANRIRADGVTIDSSPLTGCVPLGV